MYFLFIFPVEGLLKIIGKFVFDKFNDQKFPFIGQCIF